MLENEFYDDSISATNIENINDNRFFLLHLALFLFVNTMYWNDHIEMDINWTHFMGQNDTSSKTA